MTAGTIAHENEAEIFGSIVGSQSRPGRGCLAGAGLDLRVGRQDVATERRAKHNQRGKKPPIRQRSPSMARDAQQA